MAIKQNKTSFKGLYIDLIVFLSEELAQLAASE